MMYEFKQLKISGSGYKEVGVDNTWYSPENSDVIEWLKTNTPEPEFTEKELQAQELAKQVQEAKAFLDKTDKKVLPDYEFKECDNTLEWYIEERSKARAFIRENEVI